MARLRDMQTNYNQYENGNYGCGISAIIEYINEDGKLASRDIMGLGIAKTQSEALAIAQQDLRDKASRYP